MINVDKELYLIETEVRQLGACIDGLYGQGLILENLPEDKEIKNGLISAMSSNMGVCLSGEGIGDIVKKIKDGVMSTLARMAKLIQSFFAWIGKKLGVGADEVEKFKSSLELFTNSLEESLKFAKDNKIDLTKVTSAADFKNQLGDVKIPEALIFLKDPDGKLGNSKLDSNFKISSLFPKAVVGGPLVTASKFENGTLVMGQVLLAHISGFIQGSGKPNLSSNNKAHAKIVGLVKGVGETIKVLMNSDIASDDKNLNKKLVNLSYQVNGETNDMVKGLGSEQRLPGGVIIHTTVREIVIDDENKMGILVATKAKDDEFKPSYELPEPDMTLKDWAKLSSDNSKRNDVYKLRKELDDLKGLHSSMEAQFKDMGDDSSEYNSWMKKKSTMLSSLLNTLVTLLGYLNDVTTGAESGYAITLLELVKSRTVKIPKYKIPGEN